MEGPQAPGADVFISNKLSVENVVPCEMQSGDDAQSKAGTPRSPKAAPAAKVAGEMQSTSHSPEPLNSMSCPPEAGVGKVAAMTIK